MQLEYKRAPCCSAKLRTYIRITTTEVIRGQSMTSFEKIDERRAKAGITRKALYQAAGVNKETWRRTVQGTTSPNMRTLEKLKSALDELVDKRLKALKDEGGEDGKPV